MGRPIHPRRCRADEDGVSRASRASRAIQRVVLAYHFVITDATRYISRANPRDAQRHVIVGVQSYKPTDFARQMNVSITNGWGIVRTIADLALKQPEGKYVLVKDPNNVSTVPPHKIACF